MFKKILEHKITITVAALACVAVIVLGVYYFVTPPARHFSTTTATITDIHQLITESGKVDSDDHVSLSFKKAGTVSSVRVKVGDVVTKGQILASLDASDLYASLQGAQADVLAAQANQASVQKGATSETRAVSNQSVATAGLALATANQAAYIKVRDALLNKTDAFFQNATGQNPQFQLPTESYNMFISINSSRVDMTGRLDRWNSLLNSSPSSSAATAEAVNDLAAATAFINTISSEVNRLTTTNSSLTQAQIAADVTAVTSAATEVNTATTDFNTANQGYKSAVDQAAVVQASSTPENLQAAQAQIAKAQANVASIQSQIADTTLVAPFDGVIGSVSPKVGEAFSASVPAIDVLSAGNYKIDIMIPENEIGGVRVGSPAIVTFDAYGTGLEATATVATVDLSETITDGVGAYKATVYLNSTDPSIRTGMTGNVSIMGLSATGVLAVPSSAVISENGANSVLYQAADGSFVTRQVQVGLSGGGWTQIVSGLSQGDTVATFGSSNQ